MKITWQAARNNAGLLQKEVCKRIGIGLNTLIEWEKYRKYPNVVFAEKLCELYGCDLSDIMIYKEADLNGDVNGKAS